MAHNLNILHYMYKKFICKNLASVGYYIGGMSEDELKKSEKKQESQKINQNDQN